MDKVAAFCIGNAVGLTILFTGILISAPNKMKETAEIQKQQQQAATMSTDPKIDSESNRTKSLVSGSQSSESKPGSDENKLNKASPTALNIVASQTIDSGTTITEAMVALKSREDNSVATIHDASGIARMKSFEIIGKRAKIKIAKDQIITKSMIIN